MEKEEDVGCFTGFFNSMSNRLQRIRHRLRRRLRKRKSKEVEISESVPQEPEAFCMEPYPQYTYIVKYEPPARVKVYTNPKPCSETLVIEAEVHAEANVDTPSDDEAYVSAADSVSNTDNNDDSDDDVSDESVNDSNVTIISQQSEGNNMRLMTLQDILIGHFVSELTWLLCLAMCVKSVVNQ